MQLNKGGGGEFDCVCACMYVSVFMAIVMINTQIKQADV